MRVGVDTGGTFTDVVTDAGAVVKVPSRPADPASAVTDGLRPVRDCGEPSYLAHGTTVATNALLEGRLGDVALVTNAGLEDVIEIARQDRPSLYDQWADRPPPLVPRSRRHGIAGRLDGTGHEVEPLEPAELDRLRVGVPSVAVVLLHSDLDPSHERRVGEALRGSRPGRHVLARGVARVPGVRADRHDRRQRGTCGRCVATTSGASPTLAPAVGVMTSAGGLVDLAVGAERPASLLLSGPAAGVRAAAWVARANGFPGAISFDMGGTSTDVCLILGGLPDPAPSLVIGGYPVRLPALAIHTIGAGGGSIARIDAGGALEVGPRSAGAVPGPACYRRGGTEPTVTDADLVLGRIPPDAALPGLGRLDRGAAVAALEGAGLSAQDVVAVVDAAMVEALRAVSVRQGVDPRELALVAFGGAGPLHACALAEALGMAAVVVPARAGVFSAVGLVDARPSSATSCGAGRGPSTTPASTPPAPTWRRGPAASWGTDSVPIRCRRRPSRRLTSWGTDSAPIR